MWLSLLGMAVKTAGSIYSNKQKTKQALSDAALLHAEKMARGEIEYQGKALDSQKNDWKDEFILLVLSSPLFLLAYSVFAEDEKIGQKLDLYFEKLQGMPWWITGLWISVVAAVYGIKATDIINTNKNNGVKK
jgi:uncharacterized ion transporter superfamily protein YfcC